MEPITGVRTTTLTSQAESRSASRVVPISVSARAHQSPPDRRDMVAFTKASQAAATAATASASKPSAPSVERKKEVTQEKSVKVKEVSHQSMKGSYERTPASLATEQKSVKVVTPPLMTLDSQLKQEDHKPDLRGKLPDDKDKNAQQVRTEKTKGMPSEKKVLDTVLMEEIIENVMKPAGLGLDLSAPDSKMTYQVEKTEEEDGTTKTQIILESKVQEDVDLSQDSALEELLSKGVKTVTLEDIKGTSTASMIQNIIGLGLKEGESMENKRVNIKIIEEPVETPSDEEAEMMSDPEYFQPSSTTYRIEELESVHQTSKESQMGGEAMKASTKETEYEGNGSVRILESSTDIGTPYSSQDQESQEYFVSTPEDNMSEAGEGGFASYGHYGVVDDLSDERYYQEGAFPVKKHYSEESDSFRDEPEEIYEEDMRSYVRDNIPECIIEEEVRVSPMVQESVLGILSEESLDPKEQLKGALEKLQGTVSGPLKEELSRLTQAELEGADNVSVDIRKMKQTSDNGTTTIVAELNVTQSLENSGLLGEGDDLSEEQIMAALRSNSELQKALSGGSQGGYTMKVSRQEVTTQDMPWMTESEGTRTDEDIMGEISKTEHHIKLGPNETTFTFQMDANTGLAGAGGIDIQGLLQQEGASDHDITGAHGPKLKVSQEKKVATVFLESTKQE